MDEHGKKCVDTEAWLQEEFTDKKHLSALYEKYGMQEGLTVEEQLLAMDEHL